MAATKSLLSALLLTTVGANQIEIRIKEQLTKECPIGQKQRLLDKESIKFSWRPIVRYGEVDQVTLVEQNGRRTAVTFPGCYHLELSFKALRPLRNPYAEVDIRLGETKIPCSSVDTAQESKKQEEEEMHLCTNITTSTDYCPVSMNSRMRQMMDKGSSCRFCNLCQRAKKLEAKYEKYAKFLVSDPKVYSSCELHDVARPYTFKMQLCTPNRTELEKADDKLGGKLSRYWRYFKYGTVEFVVHLAERDGMGSAQKSTCVGLCHLYGKNSAERTSRAYARLFRKQIERVCGPHDEYLGCVYSTTRFTVSEQA